MSGSSSKKILLTGKRGFIGKNLFESLNAKFDVFAPEHNELELLNEAKVKEYIKDNGINIIIHSAATPSHRKIKGPRDVAIKNLKMFFNIVKNKAYFSKMIFLGSGAEYGMNLPIHRVKEEDFDNRIPDDENGFSKYICSKYIEGAENIVNLRCFGVFGKYEDYQIRFISNAICKAIFGLPVTIKQNRVFSYLYMNDLCGIVKYFIENAASRKIYNAVPKESIDLLTIANKIKSISGANVDIIIRNEGMGKEYTADNSRLNQELKNFKFTPFDKALEELYHWYVANKDIIDKDLLLYDP
ncbi:MAG: NAD(P)-dependent oxidoreductase [Candidatus Omnitrophica bacterium]|nr:NAD(P)-dependent oxidoreductase [Candidatus Omnitrophota bacterium]MDD5429426.1 NAD(P)-dependent oxidoreductase [Candidatus Omnitrophota bacterium]